MPGKPSQGRRSAPDSSGYLRRDKPIRVRRGVVSWLRPIAGWLFLAVLTAGLALGLDRHTAARFSFLLAIPVIAAAGGYGVYKIAMQQATIGWPEFSLALAIAALTAFFCIWAFLRLLTLVGLLPFIIYRLLLGAVLSWIAFF